MGSLESPPAALEQATGARNVRPGLGLQVRHQVRLPFLPPARARAAEKGDEVSRIVDPPDVHQVRTTLHDAQQLRRAPTSFQRNDKRLTETRRRRTIDYDVSTSCHASRESPGTDKKRNFLQLPLVADDVHALVVNVWCNKHSKHGRRKPQLLEKFSPGHGRTKRELARARKCEQVRKAPHQLKARFWQQRLR